MRWKESKDDTLYIGWPKIQKELESVGTVEDVQVAGFDQVSFIVNGVKVSFYAAPRKRIPSIFFKKMHFFHFYGRFWQKPHSF